MKFATPRAERIPSAIIFLRGAGLAMTVALMTLARGAECCAAADQRSCHGEDAPRIALAEAQEANGADVANFRFPATKIGGIC